MSWEKGLISVGGDTQGQAFKYLPYKFTQAPDIGHNSYELMVYTDEQPLTAYGNDFSWSPDTQITNHTFLMFPIYDANETLIRYLTIKYGYRAYDDGGRKRLIIDMDVGYTDLNQSYTHQYGISCANSVVSSSYLFIAKIHICFGKYNNDDLFGIAIQIEDTLNQDYQCEGVIITRDWLQGLAPEDVEKSPEFGDASVPDGYGIGGVIGTHDKHSDHVGIPTKPQYGFTSAGFLNHYRISAQGLSMLGAALFPEPQGPSIDIPSAIDRMTANAWNSKIIDYIIDCRIIPVTAPATNQVNITCGGKVLVNPDTLGTYSAYLVDEDFVDVDCGTITTGLTEGNFIDFSVTRAKIFIPFYGYVDLAPEYWHGAKIGLYYRFNLMDGSFMTWLTSSPFRAELERASDMEIIGQYAGNACIHLPINSQSYSQIIGGMITTGAAIVGAAAGGAIGGAAGKTIAAGAVQTAISGAANIATGRPQLISNNSYNGSAALMSNRTPYLLIEFGEAQFSTKYTEECGLPLVVNKLIGNCSGMTVCDNAIINFACTDAEAKEILAALREGIIV